MSVAPKIALVLMLGGTACLAGAPFPQGRGRSGSAQVLPGNRPGRAGRSGGRQSQPGSQLIDRLAGMKPKDREKALANMPPERREALMKRLDVFESMPPGARDQSRRQLERMRSLPEEKQQEVRQSLRIFQGMPEDRKAALGSELEKLRTLPVEDRQPHISSDDFQARFSGRERRILGNLVEILPPQ